MAFYSLLAILEISQEITRYIFPIPVYN